MKAISYTIGVAGEERRVSFLDLGTKDDTLDA